MATLTGLLTNSGQVVPPGTVMAFSASTAPSGYMKCNGAAISRDTYSDLFTAIGTTFGTGDGSTTFNIPDLRGEHIRGWDDGRGVDSGRSFGSFQNAMIPRHRHDTRSWYLYGWGHAQVQGGSHFGWGTSSEYRFEPFGDSWDGRSLNVGGGYDEGSHNRVRTVALLFCIKF